MNKSLVQLVFGFFLLMFSISCKNREIIEFHDNTTIIKKKYYINSKGEKDGFYHEYFKNGRVKIISNYIKNKIIDSTIYFQYDGKLDKIINHKKNGDFVKEFNNNIKTAEGFMEKGLKKGKWNFFNDKLIKTKTLEYINLCGTQYLNQGWHYDSKGDTIKIKSNFLKIKINQKISPNDTINIFFEYFPILSNKPTIVACQSVDLDDDFCNINKISLDTLITTSTKFKRKILFKDKGIYNLRGFIEEHNNLSINNSDEYKLRHVYYNLLIKVN
jgi:hypothetical protein